VETLLCFALRNALLATALALPAALVSRFCQRPALAYGLWLVVVLKLFTPPLWSVPVPWLSPPAVRITRVAMTPVRSTDHAGNDLAGIRPPTAGDAVGQEPFRAEAAAHAAPALPADVATPAASGWLEPPWAWAVGFGWAAGSSLWLASVGWRLGRFQRLLRGARRAPCGVQMRARGLAYRVGLRRCPDIWFVPGRVSPMLWSWAGAPRLLLPETLWEQLHSTQQDSVLAHELAHLRRRDHWFRWLEFVAVAVYWWHPLVWWAQRELEESAEQCCDAWVVAVLPAAAEVYAEALLQTVTYLSQARVPVAVAATGGGRVHQVRRRLIMILDGTTPKMLSPAGRWAVLIVAAVLLPLWPTGAHSQLSPARDSGRPTVIDPFADTAQTGVDASPDVATRPAQEGREQQIKQARAAVRKLTSELADLQDRVQVLSARLHEARARLARLEGGKELLPDNIVPQEGNFRRRPGTSSSAVPLTVPTSPNPASTATQPLISPGALTPPPTATQPLMSPRTITTAPATAQPRVIPDQPGERRANPFGTFVGPSTRRGGGDYDQRLREVETKLDQLLQELKTLREGQPSRPDDPRRR
jgi:Zn-dependent protease with chaperone function